MDTDRHPESLSTEPVTVDQVVALNLRYWRRAAGLTQEELGARLDWSAANVSAAERSWDGERDRRRFDSQTLAEISLALGVPLVAFFLPPPDDGTTARYAVTAGGREFDMKDLTTFVVMSDTEDETPVMDAYRDRFNEVARRYLNREWAAIAARWVGEGRSPQARADFAVHLRDERAGLLRAAALLAEMAEAVDPQDGKP